MVSAGPGVRLVGYATAVWCLGFALANVDDLATGRAPGDPLGDYATGIAAMSVLVLLLKLVGAVVALASVRPARGDAHTALAVALWGAFGLLGVYSAGNIAITIVTVTGLVEPSSAWEAAGGVTPHAVLYVLFFLVGAAMFGVLTLSYHRRHDVRIASAVTGLLGAPVLLALLLGVAPWALGRLGWLP